MGFSKDFFRWGIASIFNTRIQTTESYQIFATMSSGKFKMSIKIALL